MTLLLIAQGITLAGVALLTVLLYVVVDNLQHLQRTIDPMTTQFANLQQAVDTLTATITAEDTVIDGAVTLITSIPDLIKSAVEDALAKGAPPSTLSAFGTLNDVLQQKSDALASAIATTKTGAPAENPSTGASDSSAPAGTDGDSTNT